MAKPYYHFTLIINDVPRLTDDLIDALYEAGCDDGVVCHGNGEIEIEFAREAPSLREAIQSAIANVKKTGLKVSRVQTEEYILLESLNRQLTNLA